jgi:uncharacterized protein (TIGR02687 family)
MAELNLKQITDKLNSEFTSEVRKLVFWYDDNAEFDNDIGTLKLENAKILRLAKDNQFKTKYLLEIEDTKNHYLIYAPFPKPNLKDNHLEDTLLYSKEFFADRASLIINDLGMDEKLKSILQYYNKFFYAKERTQKFYDLEIENFSKQTIEMGLMSVICRTRVVSFEEIVRSMITGSSLKDNKYVVEFKRYNLLEPFWEMCEGTFGYKDAEPSLAKFIYTIFTTYVSKVIQSELPQAWKNYCSHKTGSSIAFIDSIMNSLIYHKHFEDWSTMVYNNLKGDDVFSKFDPQDILHCGIFYKVDVYIIQWLIERLESEDIEAKLNDFSMLEVCGLRTKMHYGKRYANHYAVIEHAYRIISKAHYEPQKSVEAILEVYLSKDYLLDQSYRYFYYNLDKIENYTPFERVRDLVESIYTNKYLDTLTVAWNHELIKKNGVIGILKQQNFFQHYLKSVKERVVVIISDALRYEVGKSLLNKLESDEKCTATIDVMQGILPTYTRLGMSSLLPYKDLSLNENDEVTVDGKVCDDLKAREQVLQKYVPKSRALSFDDIKNMKISELKEIVTGQELIYVYHDQIDARGDKLKTENEVFTACEEAIEEIHSMIKRLTSANNIRFIVTADHGFIYKRDKLSESGKISGFDKKSGLVARRYLITEEGVKGEGLWHLNIGDVFGNQDKRKLTLPIGSDIFKISGGGQNFVHGGSSLQEMIIPVIEVKTDKSYKETKSVQIALVSLIHKITNLTTNLDFIQSEVVSDVNKEARYKLYFISDDNEKISNENIYVADKKDQDASKRVFRLKFSFKNKKYDHNKKYYLVAYDEKNALEVIRHEIQMDLAFVDDFGFNV